jgi:predicted glutamine amidotransferase
LHVHASLPAPLRRAMLCRNGMPSGDASRDWTRRLHDRKERLMCRWLAYSGSPILLKEALYTPAHSLIDQSLHSRLGAETTNGDGFGVGWYGDGPNPGVFHSTEPAWNDQNLHEVASHISSPHFFAHIRAAIGSAVQQTNCHPFRHGRWLFMHNGYINELAVMKRDLVLAVDPSLFSEIKGQTDSEVLFFLALSFGLEDDPLAAIERAIGLVEQVGSRLGVPNPFQGTIATTDGESIWAVRYSSEGNSRTLYYTTDVPTLRRMYPDRELLHEVSEDTRLIVSEPLGDVPGVWNAVPEATCGVVRRGQDEMRPFRPQAP